MKNLDDFKVEELEQRLEMGSWSASAKGGGTNEINMSYEVTHTINF